VLSPAAHGAWLARTVPGADLVVSQSGGHMRNPDSVRQGLRWLTSAR